MQYFIHQQIGLPAFSLNHTTNRALKCKKHKLSEKYLNSSNLCYILTAKNIGDEFDMIISFAGVFNSFLLIIVYLSNRLQTSGQGLYYNSVHFREKKRKFKFATKATLPKKSGRLIPLQLLNFNKFWKPLIGWNLKTRALIGPVLTYQIFIGLKYSSR